MPVGNAQSVSKVLVDPQRLIGAAEVSRRLGIDRSTLTRRVQSGAIEPLTRLDGNVYVFDGETFPDPDEPP